jgi:hypothetical protein
MFLVVWRHDTRGDFEPQLETTLPTALQVGPLAAELNV